MVEIVQYWGKEILSIALLYPLLWFALRSNQKYIETLIADNKKCASGVTESFKFEMNKFYDLLSKHTADDYEGFKNIQSAIVSSIGKTKLSNEQLIEISRSKLWLVSEKKLDYIRKRLEKNNLKERKEIIKKQIKVELSRQSDEYIDFLNQFNSNAGPIGNWIQKNFDFDNFIEEIYDIIFRADNNILQKVEDCRFIMLSRQNELFEKLKKELN